MINFQWPKIFGFLFCFFISPFKIEENNMYMQRQSLLKEIDRSRERENELKMRMEAFEK